MRPGQDAVWLRVLRDKVIAAVEGSSAPVTVHTANWRHDLDQVLKFEFKKWMDMYRACLRHLDQVLDVNMINNEP